MLEVTYNELRIPELTLIAVAKPCAAVGARAAAVDHRHWLHSLASGSALHFRSLQSHVAPRNYV